MFFGKAKKAAKEKEASELAAKERKKEANRALVKETMLDLMRVLYPVYCDRVYQVMLSLRRGELAPGGSAAGLQEALDWYFQTVLTESSKIVFQSNKHELMLDRVMEYASLDQERVIPQRYETEMRSGAGALFCVLYFGVTFNTAEKEDVLEIDHAMSEYIELAAREATELVVRNLEG